MNSPKRTVAITDWTFADLSVEEAILRAQDVDLVAHRCQTESELIELCAEADAVITQYARLNARVIAAMRQARVIVRYGVGVDNVDLDKAREVGIPVCNIPDYCLEEVADQTLAFILATTRQVVTHTSHLRSGKWGLATPLGAMKVLRDLTVGVLGFGRIGREVVKRLVPFKCELHVCDPLVSRQEIERRGARAVSFEELLEEADVLTLHCPSMPQTRRLMNETTLDMLKPGAIFINVSRGELVDSDALVSALRSGHLGAAALDVFDPEPIPVDHPIRTLPNVILSPHIAAASLAAVTKLRESAAHIALAALHGKALPTTVNGVKEEHRAR